MFECKSCCLTTKNNNSICKSCLKYFLTNLIKLGTKNNATHNIYFFTSIKKRYISLGSSKKISQTKMLFSSKKYKISFLS